MLVFVEHLVLPFGHGAGDNQRCAGVIDEHRVDLVDNGVVVLALHHILWSHRHVVAEVVEAEFVVGAECYVAFIGAAACGGVGAVLVDAVYGRAVEHVERAHPFGVALGKVVVDRHHVHAFAREGAEEHREGGHEGFALAGCHLGDFARVEHYTADELHIVMHHIPGDFVAAGKPVVFPDSLVAVDGYEVASLGGELAVKLGGCNLDCLVCGEAGGGLAHGGEYYGEVLVEFGLDYVEHVFLVFVNVVPERLALVEGEFLDFLAELFGGVLVGLGCGGDVGAHLVDFSAELVDGEVFESGADGVDFVDYGFDFLEVALRLVSENLA